MDINKIKYKIRTADKDEIYSNLLECNNSFIPALDSRVNLIDYAKKLFEKSVTFEAWQNQKLIGLLAVYFNDLVNHIGYITNVSISKDYARKGIALELIKMSIAYANQHNFREIKLEVHNDNKPAINLYKKLGFIEIEDEDGLVLMKLGLV